MKKFDLNIETILENWEVYHAIREIIANAIDEQLLTNTKDIQIQRKGKSWIIRDYGRGLHYTNLTQNENNEKLKNPNVIGKFGIGLKDALATLDRKKVKVTIKTKYGIITLIKSQKHNFEDITTLHAAIDETKKNNKFIGTEFSFTGIKEKDIEKAKHLFLKFTGETILEKTKYGEIVEKKGQISNIYINGVKVAEENNFLFSYNITALTTAIKKALNRERTNVGRTAYTERVKSILLASTKLKIAKDISEDLNKISYGNNHDELQWIDVQEHAVKLLNKSGNVLFITAFEAMSHPDAVDDAKTSGYQIITIPESLKFKIVGEKDYEGNSIIDLSQFIKEKNDSFKFKFISYNKLTKNEKEIFDYTDKIFELIGGKPSAVKDVLISETMRKSESSFLEVIGLWIPTEGKIIIKREVLSSLSEYAGVLVHEALHAKSGEGDVSRSFESEMTLLIGELIGKIFSIPDIKDKIIKKYIKGKITKEQFFKAYEILYKQKRI